MFVITLALEENKIQKKQKVFNRLHSQKGRDTINTIEKWLRNNPTAKPGERAALNYAPYQKVRNETAVIYGRKYTGHALDRMQDRGFMPSIIENTISEGQALPGSFAGTLEYYTTLCQVL